MAKPATLSICVIGSLNVDRTFSVPVLPYPGATIHAQGVFESAGGKGANQAVAAALLGAHVRLVGAVGSDTGGRFLLTQVASHGVDLTAVKTTDSPTGEAQIFVDEHGENVIVVNGGANLSVTAAQVQQHSCADEIVVSGFEVSDDVVIAAAAHANANNALFVLNPSPVRPINAAMLAQRTLLAFNEHELEEVAPGTPLTKDGLAAASRALNDSDIVVTRGSRGAVTYEASSQRFAEIPPYPVKTVDTSGCGDGFTGALVATLAMGNTLNIAAEYASAVGAYAATKRGTQSSYPTAPELQLWVSAQEREGLSS